MVGLTKSTCFWTSKTERRNSGIKVVFEQVRFENLVLRFPALIHFQIWVYPQLTCTLLGLKEDKKGLDVHVIFTWISALFVSMRVFIFIDISIKISHILMNM